MPLFSSTATWMPSPRMLKSWTRFHRCVSIASSVVSWNSTFANSPFTISSSARPSTCAAFALTKMRGAYRADRDDGHAERVHELARPIDQDAVARLDAGEEVFLRPIVGDSRLELRLELLPEIDRLRIEAEPDADDDRLLCQLPRGSGGGAQSAWPPASPRPRARDARRRSSRRGSLRRSVATKDSAARGRIDQLPDRENLARVAEGCRGRFAAWLCASADGTKSTVIAPTMITGRQKNVLHHGELLGGWQNKKKGRPGLLNKTASHRFVTGEALSPRASNVDLRGGHKCVVRGSVHATRMIGRRNGLEASANQCR